MSLLFPAYLIGLLGLGLPWLLHRFSDQKPDEQMFPSQRFLEETKPPVSRKQKLKYRVLMAVRLLSVLLLCFLFAQPWLNKAEDSVDANVHHIIAVDLSLSMRAGDSWETAISKAGELIGTYGDEDSVEIVGFDQTLFRVADNTQAKIDLERGLDSLQPGYGAADYGVLMQRLNKLALEREESVKLWVITDQQRSAMPAQTNALFSPEAAQFELVSTVTEPQRNVHVRAQAFTDDGVNVRVSVQLIASVSESFSSDNGVTGVSSTLVPSTVRVSYNGKTLLQRVVQVGQTGTQLVVFDDLIMPSEEQPVLTVSVDEADTLQADNSTSVVIQQADPIAVASLRGGRSVSDSASVFVATALETDSQASVITISGTTSLIEPSVLHLVGGSELSDNPLDLNIRQFVDQGKNALLYSSSDASRSAEQRIRGADVGLVDESHPMALGRIDWYGTEFYDVPDISLEPSDRVLVETTQRQAILVERQVPKGKILLLNDRLDGQGSNLPLQPAFVELMKSIIEYFDSSTSIPDVLITGERLLVSGNVQVLDPDDIALLSFDDSERQSGIVLNQPGVHKVIGLNGSQLVNVLLDSDEANLALASDEVLSGWQERFESDRVSSQSESDQESSASSSVLQDSRAERARARFWLWLLPLLAGAILLENILANRRLDVRRDGS